MITAFGIAAVKAYLVEKGVPPDRLDAVGLGETQPVAEGDTLVILEAMKMEHRIKADADGVVAEVRVEVGDSVDAHHVVAVLEEE